MIAHLRGTLADKQPDVAVVDVNGVGYRVFIPLSTYETLPVLNAPVFLYIVTMVREDAFHLFGFATEEERRMFNLLMGVTGIGPKLALSSLSALPATGLAMAIAQGDLVTLSRISGVGRRIAQRLILELKDKIPETTLTTTTGVQLPSGSGPQPVGMRDELISALVNLGYKRLPVERAVRQVIAEGAATVEEAIPMALKLLSTMPV